jgi:hypothetical protein
MKCLICGYEGTAGDTGCGTDFMYISNKAVHNYSSCPRCGSWSIDTIPPDLASYYPADYYSYKFSEEYKPSPLSTQRAKEIISTLKLKEDSAVLDWGAGSQALIK